MADIAVVVASSDRPTGPPVARVQFGARALWMIFVTLVAWSIFAMSSARADADTRPGGLPTAPGRDILAQIEKTFDAASRRVAGTVERSFALFGEPNAYIIGGELSGALVVGGRHGVGELHFAAGSPSPITWSALSIGIGLGANYDRVIMLVYGLDRPENIFGTYASIGGNAHFLVGANATILASDRARIVLISSGLGLRLSGDVSGLRIEPDTDDNPPRPPENICANPADCPGANRR
ncbi:EipA family protein [Bradyrhizobium genosp. P]|uniref:EipA family protein n=1 Tax=Bradyrhizobium genosp. P TaxID=83641 RepID=UPI003CF57704